MIQAVFISDLHLHPNDLGIKGRFDAFVDWAKNSVKSIYILGDFFHVWAGDDSTTEWSLGIAQQLKSLADLGISLFYMPGNRDFLVGKQFASLAGWTPLTEPYIIQLGDTKVLLVHGDRYCTKDISHQRFRLLTRNRLFSAIFLNLPLRFRNRMVKKIRGMSQKNTSKTLAEMDVVDAVILKSMEQYKVSILIHGHTHRPNTHKYIISGNNFTRYVLSDWDDSPQLLCYDNTKGFYFNHLDARGVL